MAPTTIPVPGNVRDWPVWVRHREPHAPAHAVLRHAPLRTRCGWTPAPGGSVIPLPDAVRLELMLCRGCFRATPRH